ncbi:MAG: SDR family NAD(P)-dependent oxidoreductase [Pseudomonadales bacterium]
MTKTVLITGASSGFGKLTAKRLADEDWQVAATMRTVNHKPQFDHPQIRLFPRLRTAWNSFSSSETKAIPNG